MKMLYWMQNTQLSQNFYLLASNSFVFSILHPVLWSSKAIPETGKHTNGALLFYISDPGTRII